MKLKKNLLGKLIFTLPLAMISFGVLAQDGENLIDNPSFENAQNKKIRRVGDIEKANGWVSATGARADLYSAEAKEESVMTPDNIYGSEDPKTGINYAGIVAYSYREKENRTYLQTQLSSPMKKGMRYRVQFYISLSELSKYASNKTGAYFSKKPLGGTDRQPAIITDETHIEHPNQVIFNGMYGWDLICGEYVAKGGEKYMTIGNFTNEDGIKTERVRKPKDAKGQQIIAAYYYIDDVSVELLGPDEDCNCQYGDEAKFETLTVYQRSAEINANMSAKEQVEQYNIFYAAGRYDVRIEGEKTLEALVKLMTDNPSMKLEITGHTDSEEAQSPEDKILSIRRAEYTRTLLGERGVDEKRIFVNDAKSSISAPFIDSEDDENLKDAKNRRVSFRAL